MKKNLLITCVMLLFAITSMAQNKITISGVVTDKTGETVIGASVRVKGQESKGSITDINGKYQIVDVASNATLIFSYIGMREQEIAVNGRSTINVKMEEDSQLIDEVVVVGYGSAKKRDLTGSIVTVKADEIASKPSTNPLASIQGKVALAISMTRWLTGTSFVLLFWKQPKDAKAGRILPAYWRIWTGTSKRPMRSLQQRALFRRSHGCAKSTMRAARSSAKSRWSRFGRTA